METSVSRWFLQRQMVQMLERSQSLLEYHNNIANMQDWYSTAMDPTLKYKMVGHQLNRADVGGGIGCEHREDRHTTHNTQAHAHTHTKTPTHTHQTIPYHTTPHHTTPHKTTPHNTTQHHQHNNTNTQTHKHKNLGYSNDSGDTGVYGNCCDDSGVYTHLHAFV